MTLTALAIAQGWIIYLLLAYVAFGLGVAWVANIAQPRVDHCAWIIQERYTRPVAADRRRRS
jgi:hypothetical protein